MRCVARGWCRSWGLAMWGSTSEACTLMSRGPEAAGRQFADCDAAISGVNANPVDGGCLPRQPSSRALAACRFPGAAHRVSPGGDGRIPQIRKSRLTCAQALVSGHHPRELWTHPSRSMWPSMSPPPSNQPQKDAHNGLKDQVKAASPNVPQVVGKSYLTGPNILPGRHDPDRGHTRRSTRRRCVRLNLPPPIPPDRQPPGAGALHHTQRATTMSAPVLPTRSNSDPGGECRLAQLRQAQVRSGDDRTCRDPSGHGRPMVELVEIRPELPMIDLDTLRSWSQKTCALPCTTASGGRIPTVTVLSDDLAVHGTR